MRNIFFCRSLREDSMSPHVARSISFPDINQQIKLALFPIKSSFCLVRFAIRYLFNISIIKQYLCVFYFDSWVHIISLVWCMFRLDTSQTGQSETIFLPLAMSQMACVVPQCNNNATWATVMEHWQNGCVW